MADTIYVNVGGTWKTVSNYYVNVSGTWKTGSAIHAKISNTWSSVTAAGPVDFPTALDACALDFAEFMCIPYVYVSSKQSIDGTTLDYAEWMTSPLYTRDSVFVYSAPPAPGPSTLPTLANLKTLNYTEWMSLPLVHLSASSSVQMNTLDVAEFMCIPRGGLSPTYTPPATPSSDFPTAANTATLDYAEFMCLPQVYITSKSTVDNTTLDYAEWMTFPSYSRTSTFVYSAPPAAGPSILPTATNLKTLDYTEWMSLPIVHVDSKASINGQGLDTAEFMCIPHFTTDL